MEEQSLAGEKCEDNRALNTLSLCLQLKREREIETCTAFEKEGQILMTFLVIWKTVNVHICK